MIVGSGKTFCGEHANAVYFELLCLLYSKIFSPDLNGTVFEDNLAKHLKKCNSKEKLYIYYVKDINAGSANEDEPIEEVIVLILTCLPVSSGLNTKLVENIISHSALHEPLSDPKNGDSAFKHLKQQCITFSKKALKLA
uniref:tRNA:m(4)X modification enzyme TRM13 n=1 Tax=Sinocyclocheilus grahami TaxID=75366 RepID=A0A672QCK2_SINGR